MNVLVVDDEIEVANFFSIFLKPLTVNWLFKALLLLLGKRKPSEMRFIFR